MRRSRGQLQMKEAISICAPQSSSFGVVPAGEVGEPCFSMYYTHCNLCFVQIQHPTVSDVGCIKKVHTGFVYWSCLDGSSTSDPNPGGVWVDQTPLLKVQK